MELASDARACCWVINPASRSKSINGQPGRDGFTLRDMPLKAGKTQQLA